MGNIGSRSIHAHDRKLPDETKNNRIEGVVLDAFVVVLNSAEFPEGISEVLTAARNINQKS